MFLSHRHTHGRVELTAEVSPDTILDKLSYAAEGAHIVNSVIRRSWIASTVINAYIENSIVTGGVIQGGTVIDCEISNGTIQGDARVLGLKIDRSLRIGTGTWARLPRVLEIKNDITDLIITESTNNEAYIACTGKPMRTWIKGAKRFQKVVGWSDETRALIVETFEKWLSEPLPTY